MRSDNRPTSSSRRGRRRLAGVLGGGLLLVMTAAPALAHGGGDSTESRVLVLDALTYLANTPNGYEDMVADKVGDALEAPDQEGVDLQDVAAAKQALDDGDLAKTRTLLQQSVQPLTGPVTGEETGTTVMADPADPSVDLSGLNGVLAVLSVAAIGGGVAMAVRSRPSESLGELKEQLTGGAS